MLASLVPLLWGGHEEEEDTEADKKEEKEEEKEQEEKKEGEDHRAARFPLRDSNVSSAVASLLPLLTGGNQRYNASSASVFD